MEILDWAFHQLAGSTNDFPVNSLIYICVYWTLTPSGITGTIIITSLFTNVLTKRNLAGYSPWGFKDRMQLNNKLYIKFTIFKCTDL